MRNYLLPALLATAVYACAGETSYLYDCGSDASPLMPGFVRLTPAGGENAAWGAGSVPSVRENKITGLDGKTLPPVYLNPLTCDYVYSAQAAALRLAVPPGRYRVWAAMGHPGGDHTLVWNTKIGVGSEERETNVFEGWGMRAVTLPAVAEGDGLVLKFSSGSHWLLTALAVVPEAEYDRVHDKTLGPLWERIMSLPPEIVALEKWKKVPPPGKAHAAPAQWTDRQEAEGLVVFARPWCEPVWPEELPRPGEVEAPVRMFASLDEFETTGFTIHGLRGFKKVDLRIGELVSESGDRLPAPNVHFIRYMNLRTFYNTRGRYFEGPEVVMPWSPQPLGQGRNLTVWLTTRIPGDAAPGTYRGRVELDLDGAAKAVPVTVKVLPIRLRKNPDYVFGLYYRPASNFFDFKKGPENYSQRWWEKRYHAELADMRDHGMNMLMNGVGLNEQWADHSIRTHARYGIVREAPVVLPIKKFYKEFMGKELQPYMDKAEMPPDAFFGKVADYVKTVRGMAEGKDWPELLFYIADEPLESDFVVEILLRIARTVKEAGGKTFIAADLAAPGLVPLRPLIDVWCSHNFSLSPDERAEVLRQYPNMRLWYYANDIAGSNDHVVPVGARMTYGYGLWKSGYTGMMPWIYQNLQGDPWNHLDSRDADAMNKTGDDGVPIAVMHWTAFREGIDDGRYLYTLERQIKAAREAGRDADADRAEAVLRDVREAIPAQWRYQREGVWDGETLDAYRWLLAMEIMRLTEGTQP